MFHPNLDECSVRFKKSLLSSILLLNFFLSALVNLLSFDVPFSDFFVVADEKVAESFVNQQPLIYGSFFTFRGKSISDHMGL